MYRKDRERVEEKKLNEEQLNEEDAIQEEEQTQDTQSAGEEAETQDIEQEAEVTEEASEEAEKQEKKSGKKKSLFDKKDNKLQEKVDELEDRVKRQMAEFDNFRKRTEKEKSAMFETGAKSVIEKMLPVVDNFERGLAGLSEEEMKQPFAEGMNMVYKQLIQELEKLEVKPIEAVGCEFNPELHNAVMQVESEEYESGIIAQELQKGYTYRDTVVRYSMVSVVS
ncbi:MAG: nucleotide exchange factor GrpE [Lachnospiraceae bacterium]|nr:nucleotide exchange factor GrpE [Lachnospiraceae bacterium]